MTTNKKDTEDVNFPQALARKAKLFALYQYKSGLCTYTKLKQDLRQININLKTLSGEKNAKDQ